MRSPTRPVCCWAWRWHSLRWATPCNGSIAGWRDGGGRSLSGDMWLRASVVQAHSLQFRETAIDRVICLGPGNGRRVADTFAAVRKRCDGPAGSTQRSDEHTSELQSLMRISYAVFCLKKKKNNKTQKK